MAQEVASGCTGKIISRYNCSTVSVIFTEEKNLWVSTHPRGKCWMLLNSVTFLFLGNSSETWTIKGGSNEQIANDGRVVVLTLTHENGFSYFLMDCLFYSEKPTPNTAMYWGPSRKTEDLWSVGTACTECGVYGVYGLAVWFSLRPTTAE